MRNARRLNARPVDSFKTPEQVREAHNAAARMLENAGEKTEVDRWKQRLKDLYARFKLLSGADTDGVGAK